MSLDVTVSPNLKKCKKIQQTSNLIIFRVHVLRLLSVIKFVSDLRQVAGFLRVLRFSPPIKLTSMI
jgi:hypothetical protein